MRVRVASVVSILFLSVAASATAGVIDTPMPVLPGTATQSRLLYTVTGIVDDGSIATVVHCTNIGKEDGEFGFEIFDLSGGARNDAGMGNGNVVIGAGHTRTVVSSIVQSLAADEAIGAVGTVLQGSARIVSTVKTLICNVQTMENATDPPTYAVSLPMFKAKQRGD